MKANRTLILNALLIVILLVSCKKEENNPPPTPPPPTIAIGESYQGGKIAYILQAGDIGYDANVPHGLIAAPGDQGVAPWGCQGVTISGADGTAIGTGSQNTIDIINSCSTAGIAARLCGDLVLGGYNDWYLPSLYELNELYINRVAIGGFSGILGVDKDPLNYYWSSSEIMWNTLARGQNFGDGDSYTEFKDSTFNVRAVRSF